MCLPYNVFIGSLEISYFGNWSVCPFVSVEMIYFKYDRFDDNVELLIVTVSWETIEESAVVFEKVDEHLWLHLDSV